MAELKRILIEFAVVAALGLVVGLSANAMNPDGLSLGRDYFRTGMARGPDTRPDPGATHPASGPTDATTSGPVDPVEKVAEALKAWGLQPIHFDEVKPLYEDPLYEVGAFTFIDAREDKHYTAGHIPGAHQLNYYFIDRYIEEVLPLAQGAEKVVVYCNGGDCEDSKLVADALRNEHGLDPAKLFVYVGGMAEWEAKDMPVEKGARGSGDISGGAK
jgi:rhodanese-related sulfurtransferase